jgi:hypothetical protein
MLWNAITTTREKIHQAIKGVVSSIMSMKENGSRWAFVTHQDNSSARLIPEIVQSKERFSCINFTDFQHYSEMGISYAFSPTAMVFNDALTFCNYRNATLAMPKNTLQINILKRILKEHSKQEAYLGFHNQFDGKSTTTLIGKFIEHDINANIILTNAISQ